MISDTSEFSAWQWARVTVNDVCGELTSVLRGTPAAERTMKVNVHGRVSLAFVLRLNTAGVYVTD